MLKKIIILFRTICTYIVIFIALYDNKMSYKAIMNKTIKQIVYMYNVYMYINIFF